VEYRDNSRGVIREAEMLSTLAELRREALDSGYQIETCHMHSYVQIAHQIEETHMADKQIVPSRPWD
jgi:hypothetical protein